MLTADEKKIFNAYKKAFDGYRSNLHRSKKEVIELDRFEKTLDYFFFRLQDSLPVYGFTIPPYRVSKFIVLFATKGEGVRVVGKTKTVIHANSLVFVPSGAVSAGKYSADTEGYLLACNLNFFLQERFPRHHLLKFELFRGDTNPQRQATPSQAKTLKAIFEALMDERVQKWKNKEDMIALKILELILICERLFKGAEKPKSKVVSPIYIRYLDLIQKHYKEQHSTSFYAKQFHIHPNVLNKICKKQLDQSAKQTIDNKLKTEAENLLIHTGQSVKEIAYELGFKSTSAFFRFFKRNTGASPQSWREQHLLNAG